jgi:hypothetical protein
MEGFFMLRKLALASVILASQSAYAFSGNFTATVSQDAKHQKSKDSFGIVLSQPIMFGLGYWSWSGVGATYELNKDAARWAQTTQGIDWSFKRMRIGATAKFQYDEPIKETATEYGVRVNVKLW